MTTDRGTFSPNRLDAGTELLLDRAPTPPESGRVLDLGCGYGPMALTVAQLCPAAEVVAIDVNERSRELCVANAATLGLTNIAVHAPDDATGPFDVVWSNPPIRVGKPALQQLLVRWLGQLAPGGYGVLVVNRHLGADSLQRWLEINHGYGTERLASRQGYRLLQVNAPT